MADHKHVKPELMKRLINWSSPPIYYIIVKGRSTVQRLKYALLVIIADMKKYAL